MIKVAFKTYFKNIFHFFTILGFVCLGVLVALSFFIPSMTNLVNNSVATINKSASTIEGFNAQGFGNEFVNQIKLLNWSNPIAQIQSLLTQENFINLLTTALEKGGGISVGQISEINNILNDCYTNAVNTVSKELVLFLTTTIAFSILGYVIVNIMIHFKTLNNYNVFRFIVSTILNTLFLSLIYFLMSLVSIKLKGGFQIAALVGIGLLFLFGLLSISFISYSKKGIKFKEIVNLKSVIGLIIADLIIVSLSLGISYAIYRSNQLLAVLIALPLMTITSIILENMTNAFIVSKNQKVAQIKKA